MSKKTGTGNFGAGSLSNTSNNQDHPFFGESTEDPPFIMDSSPDDITDENFSTFSDSEYENNDPSDPTDNIDSGLIEENIPASKIKSTPKTPPVNASTGSATPTPVPTPPSSVAVDNRPRIFLRTQESNLRPQSLFGMLIRIYRLDVYGSQNLTQRALYALERSTILFTVIFLFDFTMWFMLFNLIFNRGTVTFSNINSIAVILAICMALVSIIFETSLFTADFSNLSWKNLFSKPLTVLSLVGSIGVRLGLILFAAIVTAEPFHLLIFNGPIKELSRVEQGIEKGISIVDEIKDTKLTLADSICENSAEVDLVAKAKQLNEQERKEIDDKVILKQMEIESLQFTVRGGNKYPWKNRNGSIDSTLLSSKSWHKGTGCVRFLKKKYVDRPDYSTADAKSSCNSIVTRINTQIRALETEQQQLETDIRRLELKKQGIDTAPEDNEKELAQAKDACVQQVKLMHEWYINGLKGYSRKILSTASDAEVFTLSNCYNAREDIVQCADLEDKSTTYLDDLMTTDIENLTTQGLSTNILDARKKAVEAVYLRKKQICSDWCFEYQDPHFFAQMRVLHQYVQGESTQWPNRNYSLTDCHYMINVLRIPPPSVGRCASFSHNDELITELDYDNQNYINAVTIQNKTRPNGLSYVAGMAEASLSETIKADTIRCSVRLKPEYVSSLYEIRWVVNGAPRNSLGLFSQSDSTMNSAAELILNKDIYKGDTIACQVTPLGKKGQFVQSQLSERITVSDGPSRPAIKTNSGDVTQRFVLYIMTMLIGVFIPLISLIYKWSAPADLKNYYSAEFQEKSGHSLQKLISHIPSSREENSIPPTNQVTPSTTSTSGPTPSPKPPQNMYPRYPSRVSSIERIPTVPISMSPNQFDPRTDIQMHPSASTVNIEPNTSEDPFSGSDDNDTYRG